MDWQRFAAIALLVSQGVFAAIIVMEPAELGLSVLLVKWLSIANVAVGILLNQLREVQKPPDVPHG